MIQLVWKAREFQKLYKVSRLTLRWLILIWSLQHIFSLWLLSLKRTNTPMDFVNFTLNVKCTTKSSIKGITRDTQFVCANYKDMCRVKATLTTKVQTQGAPRLERSLTNWHQNGLSALTKAQTIHATQYWHTPASCLQHASTPPALIDPRAINWRHVL